MQQELVGGCTIRPQQNLDIRSVSGVTLSSYAVGRHFFALYHHDGFVSFGNSAYNKAGRNLYL